MNHHNCFVSQKSLPIAGAGLVRFITSPQIIPFSLEYAWANPEHADELLALLDTSLDLRFARRVDPRDKPYSLVAFDLEELMPSPCYKDWPEEWSPKRYVAFLKGIITRLLAYAERVYPGVPKTVYCDPMPSYFALDGRHDMPKAKWLVSQELLADLRTVQPMPGAHLYLSNGVKPGMYTIALAAWANAVGPGPKALWTDVQYPDSEATPVPIDQLAEIVRMAEANGVTDFIWFGHSTQPDPAVRQQMTLLLADQAAKVGGLIRPAATPVNTAERGPALSGVSPMPMGAKVTPIGDIAAGPVVFKP